MMEGPRHQHLHQEWQEPLEERLSPARGSGPGELAARLRPGPARKKIKGLTEGPAQM